MSPTRDSERLHVIGYLRALARLRVKGMIVPTMVLAMCACGGQSSTPSWMGLRVGASARLGYSDQTDPEHAEVFKSAAAARTRIGTADFEPAGAVVMVKAIEPVPGAAARRVVQVAGTGWSGWLSTEDLLPIPPAGAVFEVRANSNGEQQMLFAEQDDDDGTPFGSNSHVTYLDYSNNPGNPEYHVKVNDGPLAGTVGYVMADELVEPHAHGFAFVTP